MHISHHKDSSCQGQRGPRFSLSVDYKHTRRWPARPVYPQMATTEWSVWKVSATPAWPLCRRARLCCTLARTLRADVGMANPRWLVCRSEETAPQQERMGGKLTATERVLIICFVLRTNSFGNNYNNNTVLFSRACEDVESQSGKF